MTITKFINNVYKLGGELPKDIKDFAKIVARRDTYLPDKPSIENILKVLLEAERYAAGVYTEICNYTFGKDPRTYDLSLAILHEEIEHETWFEELLTGKPSGHFKRKMPGESPYVSKLLLCCIFSFFFMFSRLFNIVFKCLEEEL